MEKRVGCRGIIFKGNQIAIMHRIKPTGEYYVYPGGGFEEIDDSKEACVEREVYEEFGINVEAKKMLYEYHNHDSIQYFYLCEWISGELGTGQGPEMISPRPNKGSYFPMLKNLEELNLLRLEPKKITTQLLEDISKYGLKLGERTILIEDFD